MDDKQFEKQKTRIKKYIDKWRDLLGLWNWHLDVEWSDNDKDGIVENTEILAHTYVSWQYLDYKITFYLKSFVDKDDEEVEKVVIHEMCHVLVSEMRENTTNHEERVVSNLTNVMRWVYEEGQKSKSRSKHNKKAKRVYRKLKSKTKKVV